MLRKLQQSQVARRALLTNKNTPVARSINATRSNKTFVFNASLVNKFKPITKFYSTNAAAEPIEAEVMGEHVIEITSPDVLL